MNVGQFNKGFFGSSPCHNCPDRFVTESGERCHTTCERYISFVSEKDAVKAEKVKDNRQIREYYRTHRKKQV